MKRLFHVVLTIFLLTGHMDLLGANPKMTLGCPIVDLPKSSIVGTDKEGSIKCAMMVNPGFSEMIEDFNLVGFSFGLTSKINIKDIEVWATYSLEDDAFAKCKIESGIKKGWNSVDCETPISLEQKPFYIGYTIHTSGASYPVAIVDSDEDHEILIDTGEGWRAQKCDTSQILALGAIVSGVNLPQYDLSVIGAEIPAFLSTRNSNPISLEVRNVGGLSVSGFTLTCREGVGESIKEQSFDFDISIEPNFSEKVSFLYLPLSEESESQIPFSISISEIKDGQDFFAGDNTYSTEVRVSPFSFRKRALVEEFTTEKCVNCPRAVKLLHEVLSDKYYKSNVIAVCHHAGYFTDFLTQPCDEELLPLFGESSYAPAMAFDRAVNDNGVVVTNVPFDVKSLASTFDRYISDKAEADMIIEAKWNPGTSKLDVSVDGGSITGTPLECAERITVYLLEDNVAMQRQSGADADFRHHHVIRAYNSTWGNKIIWSDNGRFLYEVSFDVPDVVVPENCEVVAILGHVNPDNVMDCQICNANRSEGIDWDAYSGIVAINYEEGNGVQYYNLNGIPVSSDEKGVLIKIINDSTGKRMVSKVVR